MKPPTTHKTSTPVPIAAISFLCRADNEAEPTKRFSGKPVPKMKCLGSGTTLPTKHNPSAAKKRKNKSKAS